MQRAIGLLLAAVLAAPSTEAADPHRLDPADFEACGPACLYMACVARGVEAELEGLKSKCRPGPDGETSFDDLRRVGLAYGLDPVAAVVTPELLEQVPMPAIAHLSGTPGKPDHFVLMIAVVGDNLLYVDPPTMTRLEPVRDFRRRWTGAVLAFPDAPTDTARFQRTLRWVAWRPYLEAGLMSTLVAMVLVPCCWYWPLRRASPTRATKEVPANPGTEKSGAHLQPLAIACGAALAVLCVACAARLVNGSRSYPKFAVGPERIDLGLLKPGKHEFSVRIRNDGAAALEVERVVASCTCTRVDRCGAIPPGAADVIKGEVSVAAGAGSSELRVFTNEEDGLHTIWLSWFGERAPYVIPWQISMSLSPNERVTRRVQVFNATRDDLALTRIEGLSNDRGFIVDIVKAPPDAKHSSEAAAVGSRKARTRSFLLDLSVTAPAAPGDLELRPVLRLASRNSEYEHSLRLRLSMPRRLQAVPGRVFIGAPSIGRLAGRSARVLLSGEGPSPNFKVMSRPPFLDSTLTSRGPKHAELEITVNSVDGGSAAEWCHSEVTVSDGEGSSLAVPVTILFPSLEEAEGAGS